MIYLSNLFRNLFILVVVVAVALAVAGRERLDVANVVYQLPEFIISIELETCGFH